jgi:hypothetical protein
MVSADLILFRKQFFEISFFQTEKEFFQIRFSSISIEKHSKIELKLQIAEEHLTKIMLIV